MDLSTLMPQQLDIVTTLDRPLFVSAGAGSGKTFTLTRRIAWALSPESGPALTSLDQVLAITFTKDAAAEIRERVRATLIAEGMAEAALSVDDAWISTIHGMCSRILRAHALELGIDPEFGVVAEAEAGVLMDRAVDTVLAAAQGDYQELFDWYKLDAEGGFSRGANVRDLVRRLLELANASRRGFDDISLLRGEADFGGVLDAYQAAAENCGGKGRDAALAAIDAITAYLDGPRTRDGLIACLMACTIPRASKNFPKESVAWLKGVLADAFTNAYLAVDGIALDQLMELSHAVYDEYQALKADRSLLDNNDLLRMTYLALRDHEPIRSAYANRFKLVMIDEFQDTDQQQVDLISYLTGEGGRALCTVGDAQQSIYRFRGAEVEVFRRQQRHVEAAAAQGGEGRVVELVRNFRSHAQVLDYVARVFDGNRGGLMPRFLNLEPNEGRADGLVAPASRRQALLVVGGSGEDRTCTKAQLIARRFRELADAGQPVGGMVLLLGGMTRSDVYAEAIRTQGLDCVISGGSVFSQTVEARAVDALVRTLANPADGEEGLVPLLQSPLFALGAQEFLALCTAYDAETGQTRRRNADAGIYAQEDAPGFGELPLLERARTVLRCAFSRVGKDGIAAIVRDVVNESGWLVRLADQGAQGRASAANVLKALDAVVEAQQAVGNNPRAIAQAYGRFLAGKEAPGALNEEGGNAVRIMTVHASKGLEFPVVAVSECFDIRASSERMQTRRADDGTVQVAAIPATYPGVTTPEGYVGGDKVKKAFGNLLGTSTSWLTAEVAEDVCATGSVAGEWLAMRDHENLLALQERARLLYVAMTRARELCILAMGTGVSTAKGAPVKFDDERDLTGPVLRSILAGDGDATAPLPLDADHLDFAEAQPGDYELVSLASFTYGDAAYEQNAELTADGRLVPYAGDDVEQAGDANAGDGAMGSAPIVDPADPASEVPDTFTLVTPAAVDTRISPSRPVPRDSYSYSSVSITLHEEDEDRGAAAAAHAVELEDGASAEALAPAGGEEAVFEPPVLEVIEVAPSAENANHDEHTENPDSSASPGSVAAVPHDGDPTALGSAFHAAAQWLTEMGADEVPASRRDALARYWYLTPAQRERLDVALDRWCGSAVRAEALAWPRVRAEVPFFTLGSAELSARFGTYVEGAIDLLCDDPADPCSVLVLDYKTGGSPSEAPDELQQKHALQARIYADVLHRAGYANVILKFVRVEVPDPSDPAQPQVVTYEL